MPKRLPESVRHSIQTLSHRGMSIHKITQTLGVSRNTVRLWIKRDTITENGRRSIGVTNQRIGLMRRVLKNTNSLRITSRRLGVSPSTVRKYTRRSNDNPNGLFPYKQRHILRFTDSQLTQRRAFCDKLPRTDRGILNHVRKSIFYDEKPMYLEKSINRQNTRIWNDTPITD